MVAEEVVVAIASHHVVDWPQEPDDGPLVVDNNYYIPYQLRSFYPSAIGLAKEWVVFGDDGKYYDDISK